MNKSIRLSKTVFIVLSALLLLLAGCSQSAPPSVQQKQTNENEIVTITIANPFAEGTDVWFNRIFDQPLAELHPNIKFRLTKMKSVVETYPPDEKALDLLTGDTAPDLLVLDRSLAASLASKDLLVNLSLDIEKAKISPTDYYPAAWEECIYNGYSYCLPWDIDYEMLAYNKTMMKAAGIDPNTPIRTFAELDKLSDQLNKTNDYGGYEQVGFIPWVNTSLYTYGILHGGEWEKNGQLTANHSGNVKALEWVVSRHNSFNRMHIQNFIDQKRTSFTNGKNGFGVVRSWMSTVDDSSFEWGVAPLPTHDGQPAVMTSQGLGIAINKYSKHPEEAFKVLQFFAHRAGSLIMAKEGNNEGGVFLSAMPQINEELKLAEKEKLVPFLEALPNLKARPKNTENFDLYNELWYATDRAMDGDGTPASLLGELQKRAEQ